MILVLRPEPGAGDTVRRARDRGLEVRAVPLFTVAPVAWSVPDLAQFDGLLLTSANAVRHGGERLTDLRGLPVHAVGQATATAARETGFDIASSGDDGVDRLLGSIDPELRLLHLCGVDRREPNDARQQITALAVYRAEAVEAPDLSAVEGGVVMIHSPRAGARFADLIADRSPIAIAAISEAAALAAGDGWRSIDVADQPSDDALLALAARLCDKSAVE